LIEEYLIFIRSDILFPGFGILTPERSACKSPSEGLVKREMLRRATFAEAWNCTTLCVISWISSLSIPVLVMAVRNLEAAVLTQTVLMSES
jgi:hypothetical protein